VDQICSAVDAGLHVPGSEGTLLDKNVPAACIAKLVETFLKGLDVRGRRSAQNTYPVDLCRLLRLRGQRRGEEHRACASEERATVYHLGSPFQLIHPALRRRSSSARSHGTCCRTSRHASAIYPPSVFEM
jgi:hypothetical protein